MLCEPSGRLKEDVKNVIIDRKMPKFITSEGQRGLEEATKNLKLNLRR